MSSEEELNPADKYTYENINWPAEHRKLLRGKDGALQFLFGDGEDVRPELGIVFNRINYIIGIKALEMHKSKGEGSALDFVSGVVQEKNIYNKELEELGPEVLGEVLDLLVAIKILLYTKIKNDEEEERSGESKSLAINVNSIRKMFADAIKPETDDLSLHAMVDYLILDLKSLEMERGVDMHAGAREVLRRAANLYKEVDNIFPLRDFIKNIPKEHAVYVLNFVNDIRRAVHNIKEDRLLAVFGVDRELIGFDIYEPSEDRREKSGTPMSMGFMVFISNIKSALEEVVGE